MNYLSKIECACGCGEEIRQYDKWGRRRYFVSGHNQRGKRYSVEHRMAISVGNKGKTNWSNGMGVYKDYKQRMENMNNKNWFRRLIRNMKEFSNWTCSVCGISCEDNHRKLHVNHIDHDPMNNDVGNLQVICARCHIGGHKKEQMAKYMSTVLEVCDGSFV